MNFAIGETEYFNALGFDTTHWRKSLDGVLSLVHYEFVRHTADERKLTLYRHDDEAFRDVMASGVWVEQEESTEGE